MPPAADRNPGRPRGLSQEDGPAGAADRAAAARPGARQGEIPPARGRAWARDHRAPAVGRQQEGGGKAMSVLEYDTFTEGAVDPSKWVPLQLPTPDGIMWSYGDPEAKEDGHGGTLTITVNH